MLEETVAISEMKTGFQYSSFKFCQFYSHSLALIKQPYGKIPFFGAGKRNNGAAQNVPTPEHGNKDGWGVNGYERTQAL